MRTNIDQKEDHVRELTTFPDLRQPIVDYARRLTRETAFEAVPPLRRLVALQGKGCVALPTGVCLYLIAHVAFLRRATGRIFRRRTLAAATLLALIPAALAIPAIAALALVGAVCSLVVAYEAIGRRESRGRIRHPELASGS